MSAYKELLKQHCPFSVPSYAHSLHPKLNVHLFACSDFFYLLPSRKGNYVGIFTQHMKSHEKSFATSTFHHYHHTKAPVWKTLPSINTAPFDRHSLPGEQQWSAVIWGADTPSDRLWTHSNDHSSPAPTPSPPPPASRSARLSAALSLGTGRGVVSGAKTVPDVTDVP